MLKNDHFRFPFSGFSYHKTICNAVPDKDPAAPSQSKARRLRLILILGPRRVVGLGSVRILETTEPYLVPYIVGTWEVRSLKRYPVRTHKSPHMPIPKGPCIQMSILWP